MLYFRRKDGWTKNMVMDAANRPSRAKPPKSVSIPRTRSTVALYMQLSGLKSLHTNPVASYMHIMSSRRAPAIALTFGGDSFSL